MKTWMCGVLGSNGSSAPENSAQASCSASRPYASTTKGSIVVAMENSSSARRTRRQDSACGESAAAAAARQQQCLYFLPLPQGQGSFRPGVMGALVVGRVIRKPLWSARDIASRSHFLLYNRESDFRGVLSIRSSRDLGSWAF